MAYWWVSQNKTGGEEHGGGYLSHAIDWRSTNRSGIEGEMIGQVRVDAADIDTGIASWMPCVLSAGLLTVVAGCAWAPGGLVAIAAAGMIHVLTSLRPRRARRALHCHLLRRPPEITDADGGTSDDRWPRTRDHIKARAVFRFAAMLCAISVAIAAGAGAAEDPPPSATVAQGVNLFAFDLYGALRSEQSGNLFFSPQSISTALAMTYTGARGETAAEMARTMHFSLPPDRLSADYAELLRALREPGGTPSYRLSIADRLWGQRGVSYLAPFVALTRRDYGAEPVLADFASNAEGVRREINAWVAQETEGKITDLVPARSLGSGTRLVIANAIYFRGNWAEQFERSATRNQPFHVSAGTTVDVPLMSAKLSVGYWRYPEAALTIVQLPYKGNDLSMLVILPDAPDGLAGMEAQLTAENIRRWTVGFVPETVLVYLPRFSVESGVELSSTLATMGMRLPFSDAADFSGVTGQRDVYLSAVWHKARVDVDERGTEAAAATGVNLIVGAVASEPPTFRADHPFVFLIRHNRTGAILFLGRLTNPKS